MADVAQLAERRFCKPLAGGSSPLVGSMCETGTHNKTSSRWCRWWAASGG